MLIWNLSQVRRRPQSTSPRFGIAPVCNSRAPMVVIFYPENYGGCAVDGAFVIESFYYMESRKGKVEYLPELLAKLHRETG